MIVIIPKTKNNDSVIMTDSVLLYGFLKFRKKKHKKEAEKEKEEKE